MTDDTTPTTGTHLDRTLSEVALYPPHPPRKPTARYTATHKKLVKDLDRPCLVCGVRDSTLKDPAQNIWGAKAIETHHRLVEDSLANAIDVDVFNAKILPSLLAHSRDAAKYGHPFTEAEMCDWIHGDEDNMWCLCLAGDSPVLMADGTQKPIRDVTLSDAVIGHDGEHHQVTGVMQRLYEGPIVDVDGVRMTPNHPVFTLDGWTRADQLTVGQIVYQVRMLSPEVIPLVRVEHEIGQDVVRPVSVSVMNTLLSREATPESLLHDPAVLHGSSPSILDGVPEYAANIAAARTMQTAEACGLRAGESIQLDKAAAIRAGASTTLCGDGRLNSVGAETDGTGAHDFSTLNDGPSLTRAGVGTSHVAGSTRRGNEEICPADQAYFPHPVCAPARVAGWCPINEIHIASDSLIVHDIAVEGCQSFIAGSLAVHNCDIHHRHPYVGIHAITFPIWSAQDLIKKGYDLTGFHAVTPHEAAALTALPQTTGTAAPLASAP